MKLLAGVIDKKDENSVNLYFHLVTGLSQFPQDLLIRHKESFVFNKRLKELYEIITNRNQIQSRPPEILWEELTDICKQDKGKSFDDKTGQYLNLLVEGLCQNGDGIKHKVIMSLSQATTDYDFELYMVKIAGELKIHETTPYLFRILIDSDVMDLVHEECVRSLGKIGGREVVDQIELLYPKHESLRAELASILKWIPYQYSEDLAIRLLKEEHDPEQKTFLAEALCGMFSLKSADLIKNIIENQHYDPLIVNLADLLEPIYEYYHQTSDLSALQKKERRLLHTKMEKDPLHQELSKLTNNMTKQEAQKVSKVKSAEMIPAHAGAGKNSRNAV